LGVSLREMESENKKWRSEREILFLEKEKLK
jgi:hypothetical protein